ncbi:MAG TPA: VOC family protein [Thermodesulfobacteriota bacterium]|jgi:lactoylglutathione lyase
MKWIKNLVGRETLITGIDHVAIVVSDMDRSIEFYNEVLGLSILKDGRIEGGKKKSFLGTKDHTLIALTEDKKLNRDKAQIVESVAHVAFEVDDVEKASKTLKNKGISFIEEKVEKDGKIKAYHFLDPDGLELEIYGETGESVPPY